MTSKYYNLSFYSVYATWCTDPANSVGDYSSFTDDLKRQANRILDEFTQRDFDDFQWKKPDEFSQYCDTLKAFKSSRRGYARDEVVQTDVNNYMFIRSLNDQEKAVDFFGTHNYLISADHVLGDWAREQRPGSVPIVVLPSVWYSLILQYTGRADDDFAAFTRFLNFSLVSFEEEDPRKVAILKKVIELDEPKEIKERTIYDIEKKLATDYKDFDSVDDIVETSHEYVLDQERARISEEIRKKADEEIASVKATSLAEKERAIQDKESEHALERSRHAQAELALSEKNQELLGKIDEARKQGAREQAERLADAALPRTTILYWSIAIILFSVFLFIGYVIIMKLVNGELSWLPEVYGKAAIAFDVLAEAIVAVLGFVIVAKGLCGLDKKAIRERLIEKYSK